MTPEDNLKKMLDGARGPDHVRDEEWNAFVTTARRSLRTQRLLSVAGAVVVIALGVFVTTSLDDAGPNDRSVQPIGSPEEDSTPYPSSTGAEASAEATPPAMTMVRKFHEIWLVDPEEETLSWGYREVDVPDGRTLEAVIQALLEGPTSSDAEAGIVSAIPEGVSLLGVSQDENVAEIDLSAEFLNNDGDSATENVGENAEEETSFPGTTRFRQAQIVFTATQVPGIDEVMVLVEGAPYMGAVNPSGRDDGDYEDIAPPIVLVTPKISDTVELPLHITGTANVFEATVTIEVDKTEEDERPLQTFATATCGSGCRGDFSKTIDLDINKPTPVELRVYEESAEDGLPRNLISIPLTVTPAN